ncbi:hypothetical protein N0V90_003093 [Kalmusia sp. IMI 367209]|nr:hypothetical protein N0V90_003093 [Kalmusia sp. IMI 367209]
MAEDPFVTSTQQPHIYRPIPRRNFSTQSDAPDSPVHAYVPSTPPSIAETQNRPSDFLAQLNARLLRTYNAGLTENGAAEGAQPQRNKSLMNLTKSTLFGIYDDDDSTPVEQSVPETPWGTGAETPGRKFSDANRWDSGHDSPHLGLTMAPRTRTRNVNVNGHAPQSPTTTHAPRPQRRGIWKYTVSLGKLAALFLFGVTYGVIVSHLHDSRELAAVRVEGVDRGNWTYLASWGLAGLVLGSCLPYVELAWGAQTANGQETTAPEKESETSFSEQWNDIVRSVGAFVGIAFAIRRLPWQSTLQLTLTLALVNPALWYILDRSKPGLSFSLIVTSILTSFIFLSDPDILPSPSLPATINGTHTMSTTRIQGQGQQQLFAGLVSYETLAVIPPSALPSNLRLQCLQSTLDSRKRPPMSTLDLSSLYILTNGYTLSTKQLASSDSSLSMEAPSTADSHLWYLTGTDISPYYRLHTKANGDSKTLDVFNDNDINSTSVHFASQGRYSGQYWRLDEWGDGTYRLSNNFTGESMHLDAYADTLEVFLGTGDHAGQHWSFDKYDGESVTKVSSSTQPSSGLSTKTSLPTSATAATPSVAPAGASSSSSGSALSIGAIVGIAVGGLVLLTFCVCAVIFCLRGKRIRGGENAHDSGLIASPAYLRTAAQEEKNAVTVHPAPTQRYQYPVELVGSAAQDPVEMPTRR